MLIENMNVLDGPNYWSVKRHKLIVMTLNLEELEERPTNTIEGFSERIQNLLPGLIEHRCSEGTRGGFFSRVESGTWMGHVIEHIALEIQTMAGIETGFGRTRGTGDYGKYHVVFSYETPGSGKYAAHASVRIADALVNNIPYDVEADVNAIRERWESEKYGPSTGSIVEEALRRNIPVIKLNDESYVQLGYGKNQKRIEATITSNTTCIGVDNAGSKVLTKKLLGENYIPVPEGVIITEIKQLESALHEVGFPLTIKPKDSNHGKGVTTNLTDVKDCAEAFEFAKRFSAEIIVEQHIEGNDYRILLVDYKFVVASLRTPASVTGDGVSTISQLIEKENLDPRRGDGHRNVLTKIPVDHVTICNVNKAGYQMTDVLPANKILLLRKTANLSTGGTAENVSASVHPSNIKMFERAARIIGLDICGLDIVAKDLSTPLCKNHGAIIEVNAAPGFRMHTHPTIGEPVNVARPVIDMLFPEGTPARIPIIAITGTNGKTTTTRLTAAMVKSMRKKVGYTTSDGIYIDDEIITKGDCSGPGSTRVVLQDPLVDIAVLECARGGLLRGGLGFDHCDIAIVTNVAEDHLGLNGINTIEQLARVKAVIPESVKENGIAVLNADDNLVFDMRNNLRCRIALFSLHKDSQRVREHCRKGGLAAFVDNNFLVIQQGSQRRRIEKIDHIPISFNGKATFNIYNMLAATLAAYSAGCTIDQLRSTLHTFSNNAEKTPGRLNFFELPECQVIVDYAHNTHGLKAIGNFIKSYGAPARTGIIAGIGDRRDVDIIGYSEVAAGLFDRIIIRTDKDLRNRTADDLTRLVKEGIYTVDGNKYVEEIPDEVEALQHAITTCRKNELIFLATDDVQKVIEFMNGMMARTTAAATAAHA
jgi:cyanophycin synthetase